MVILINKKDRRTGTMPKMEAHKKGLCHRAFSVFIFNSKGELLLQQRAFDKYHSGSLWTNTCCSHPKPYERTKTSAQKRLYEEMGIEAKLHYLFKFEYKAHLDHAMTEHEIDHVFIGYTDELPRINSREVSQYKYITIQELKQDMLTYPEHYTEWFKIILKEYLEYLSVHQKENGICI